MATIPLPALAVQPPPDPLSQVGKVLQLKNLMQQQQFIPGELQAQEQSLQSGGLDVQRKQLELRSTQAILNAVQKNFVAPASGQSSPEGAPSSSAPATESAEAPPSDTSTMPLGSVGQMRTASASTPPPSPAAAPAPAAASSKPLAAGDFFSKWQNVVNDAMANGALPEHAIALSGQILQQQDTFAKMSKTQQDMAIAQNKNAGEFSANLLSESDPAKQAVLWKQGQAMMNANPDAPSIYGPAMVQYVRSTPYPGEQAIQDHLGLIQGKDEMLADQQKSLANKKTAQEVEPFADAMRAQLNQGISNNIQQLTGKAPAPNSPYLLQPGAGQQQLDNINKMGQLLAESPAVAGRKAGAEAWAKVGASIAEETGKLQAQQKLFPSPTVGVAPHLVGPATAAAQKAGSEYVSAQNAADEMQSFVDLARSGNKLAYAYAPTTGVLTINAGNQVKRVNMAEIQQYGGAGSLLDRVQGWFGKQVSGQSIPPDVLNDIEQLHQQLAGISGDTYKKNLAVVNGVYGSQFQPVTLPQNTAAKAPNANRPAAQITPQAGEPTALLSNGHPAVVRDGKWVDTVTGQAQ